MEGRLRVVGVDTAPPPAAICVGSAASPSTSSVSSGRGSGRGRPADLVAAFVLVVAAATLYEHGIQSVGSAADTAKAPAPVAGHYAEILFAVGLAGASLLAAAILPAPPAT